MPVIGTPYKKDELYCPVCGHKYESKPYFIVGLVGPLPPPVTIPQKLVKNLIDFKPRYLNYECYQCKTKLIYDRKKEIIKIKK